MRASVHTQFTLWGREALGRVNCCSAALWVAGGSAVQQRAFRGRDLVHRLGLREGYGRALLPAMFLFTRWDTLHKDVTAESSHQMQQGAMSRCRVKLKLGSCLTFVTRRPRSHCLAVMAENHVEDANCTELNRSQCFTHLAAFQASHVCSQQRLSVHPASACKSTLESDVWRGERKDSPW